MIPSYRILSTVLTYKQEVNIPSLVEVFCLQNSLIVGMQPQVSGKVGSLVGWFLGGPFFGISEDCRIFPRS